MKTNAKRSLAYHSALLCGAGLVSALACEQIGCSSPAAPVAPSAASSSGGNPSDDVGSVGLSLTLPGGQTVNAITWTITGPNGASSIVQQGTVNVQNSTAINFTVSGIPAGTNYTVTVTGNSTDGTVTCSGSAQFSVSARTTTSVSDLLRCTSTVSEAGSVSISGQTYSCAAWSSVSVSPSETTVGTSVSLSATATAPSASALTYAWSAPTGSFTAPGSANTSYTCAAAGSVVVTLTVGDGPVPDGGSCDPALSTTTLAVVCDPATAAPPQALVTTLDVGVLPTAVRINQGTAIGEGALNGATPSMLTNLAADPANTQTIASNDGGPPFLATGSVPDTAAGFCTYPADGGAPTRVTHVTGAKFETSLDAGTPDPMVPLSPAYFPLVYTTTNTPTDNAFGGQPPIIGLFDWRPKDIDEGLLAAESDDNGKSWYFMQLVLELNPDFTNPISGGFSPTATSTGCPATISSTNANFVSANGSQADDGWGHASIIQLPGPANVKTGQFLYMLDRNTNDIPGTSVEIVDGNPLWVINLSGTGANGGSSNKFPIWNTNSTVAGNNDIKSISSTLTQTPDSGTPIAVQQTVGLVDPDGIMAVFPTPAATVGVTGTPVTVLWVQKILNGDNTGPTALPVAQQCTAAPFSGKVNHDIATVRLATTTDGVHFNDLGPVHGLSDPTTVDYGKTRWVSPRGTLLDVNGDGSLWGLYFAAGNCLDGDSDAFHYIGYAESPDMVNWTVYNDINHPIASINPITTTNQATGTPITVPANPPLVPTQPWFAERLYAPTATQIDSTHLSMTFAGYGVQTPNNDLLEYRQIGNVVLTVSKPLLPGVPNNINTH